MGSMRSFNISAKTPAIGLKTGGIEPFSTLDYPNHLSAVVFCRGCQWRCRYCHNVSLQSISKSQCINWEDVICFLEGRKNILEAVVFSGGEPLLQYLSLIEAINDVRHFGFKIGLHTSGYSSTRLKKVIPFIDWIGIDIKATKEKYSQITGIPNSGIQAWKSVEIIAKSNVQYECRTTVHALLHTAKDILEIARNLRNIGVKNFVIQHFRPKGCVDINLICNNYHMDIETSLVDELKGFFEKFTII